MRRLFSFKARLAAPVAAAVLAIAGCGGDGEAADSPATLCSKQSNGTEASLLACVTLEGVMRHLFAFDQIAKDNGGNRAAGRPGYDASAAYAEKVLGDAGYTLTRTPVDFVEFQDLGGSVLRQVAPGGGADIAHALLDYSGSGDIVSAAVDVVPNVGCNDEDYDSFTEGRVALVERGVCGFDEKAALAIAHGAAAIVVYNNIDGDVVGSLGEDFAQDFAAFEVTREVGLQLAATPGLRLDLSASTARTPHTTFNVIAESRGGDPDHVVMVGAHLDSVIEGPGINDNASGSAAILETAVQLANVTPTYKLRFALWGAEEPGVLGSQAYVDGLAPDELSKIALYLNFDMIASPNAGYFIYDGDDSDAVGEGPGPDGSAAIEKAFEAFYTARGKTFRGTDFDGRSDYGPFIDLGIPAGGVFSGGEDAMPAELAALWGGTADLAYDKCYHLACDGLDNLNRAALDLNADAVAAITLRYANDLDGIRATTPARMQPQARSLAKAYVPPADRRPTHLPALR